MLGKGGKTTFYNPEVREGFGGFCDHRCRSSKSFCCLSLQKLLSSVFLAPTVDSNHLESFLNSTDEDTVPLTD